MSVDTEIRLWLDKELTYKCLLMVPDECWLVGCNLARRTNVWALLSRFSEARSLCPGSRCGLAPWLQVVGPESCEAAQGKR